MRANQFTLNTLTGHNIPAVCGVYQITDTVTGRTYIGSSQNIRTRAVQHFYLMGTVRPTSTTYDAFSMTYAVHGSSAFSVSVLEVCDACVLYETEKKWINELAPTENTQHSPLVEVSFSEAERGLRSERSRKLWSDPDYRARAVAARKGKAYNKGYKCTPEQVENRKRAARISNMKRNYGLEWEAEYVRRYPEHRGDINA